MANKWDDFHENMGDEQAALHMSGAFDSEVGHDHDSTLPGRGAQISYNSLKDKPTSIAHADTATHAGSADSADTATTGPASSAGFFHFAHEAPFAGDFITNNLAIGIQSVGPTGSDATIIWTELDSLPDNVKGIRIGILLEMRSHPFNFITAGIKVRKYGSETTFSTIGYCCVGTILVKGEGLYQPSRVVVDVPVDSNKRFQFYNFCQGSTSGYWPTCQVFLEGYYI